MTRILVVGDGKMGKAVAQVATDRGADVVAIYGPAEMARAVGAGIADVAIEFTEPGAAAGNVRACLEAGIPVVSGTTGWDAQLDAVRKEVSGSGGTFMHAPNFSIGVAMFSRIVETAAALAKSAPGFSGAILETHHSAKLDAPSGTAKMLGRVAAKASGKEWPITSVRVGSVPGTHEVILDSPFEQIRLVHEARDRRVFAEGAVAAARWLVGKSGVFSFDDYINDQLG